MKPSLRRLWDRTFTTMTGLSIVLMAAALLVILGPILWRGAGALMFRGTAEFRRMQLEEFGRGDAAKVEQELQEARAARQPMYEILDRFSRGIDTQNIQAEAGRLYRQFKAQLRNRVDQGRITSAQADRLQDLARQMREEMEKACAATQKAEALKHLEEVLTLAGDPALAGTVAQSFERLARDYRAVAMSVDLTRREEYAKSLVTVQDIVRELFGPRPQEQVANLAEVRYGATRWDQAQRLLHRLLWDEQWVRGEPGKPLRQVLRPRREVFQDTELAELFPLVQREADAMLRPRRTFYWQFFLDDSTPGHFTGGVGPELLGTLLLTVLSMVFAVPLGVIAAGYLVECTRGGPLVGVIRTCVNTLAGVPSIVFGLFGLAFFVLTLQPALLLPAKSSILAGALTLAVLVLPLMIRASEEAIRAVPITYKEASLALGAGGLRTFVKVTLPAAMPGILTGIILSMSRAAGETAPILFTAAIAFGRVPESILDPTRTLSYGSYDLAMGDRLAAKVPHNQFGMIMTLVLLVLLLNIAAILLRSRMARKLRGE